MANSSLHDHSSVLLKFARAYRKNYTISHIPIRNPEPSVLNNSEYVSCMEDIKKSIVPVQEIKSIPLYTYDSRKRGTRRQRIPVKWIC
jgi:hypothetical protein